VAFDLEQAQAVPEGAVADLLAALLPRAERGDVEAMRQLYLLLQRCREWPMPSTAGPMFVDPAHLARTGMSEVQAREATESALAQAWTQQVEECRDVSAAQVATAGAWLQRAAQAGDPYAQLAYVDAVDEIVGDQRQMLAHPEVVQQFRSDAINYLQGLASRGMPDAMLRLSAAYASGVLTNRDMALAYGYGKAADQLIGGPEDVSLQEYRRSLSGEQLDRAQVLVRSLLATSR
jgi:TPR repeat protein